MARQVGRDPAGDGPAGVGERGRRLDVRRRGGAGVRAAKDDGADPRSFAARALVLAVRPSESVARDDAPSRGGGVVVLPALLHGPSARGRDAEAGAAALVGVHAGGRDLSVDALRGSAARRHGSVAEEARREEAPDRLELGGLSPSRSEEHTSELQSRQYLVCRLLLEKK